MLIIKIKQEENLKTIKKKRKLRKKYETNLIKRENIKIENEIHTVLHLPNSCCSDNELSRLLKVYKGKVVAPANDVLDEIIKDYRFDTKPYFKRAALSAFIKNSGEEFQKYKTICIEDHSFRISQEYADMAKYARNLVILSDKDINTQKFSDYCFLNLGTVINFKKDISFVEWDIYINLDDVFDDGRMIIKFKDKDAVLHPDYDYFNCNKAVSELVSYGIPIKTACAALEVKKEEDINWGFIKTKNKNSDFYFT